MNAPFVLAAIFLFSAFKLGTAAEWPWGTPNLLQDTAEALLKCGPLKGTTAGGNYSCEWCGGYILDNQTIINECPADECQIFVELGMNSTGNTCVTEIPAGVAQHYSDDVQVICCCKDSSTCNDFNHTTYILYSSLPDATTPTTHTTTTTDTTTDITTTSSIPPLHEILSGVGCSVTVEVEQLANSSFVYSINGRCPSPVE